MECKKALTEAGGDLKKAEELLRIKSGAKASKAASRVAAEGVIGASLSPDGKTGALVELNSETDFVAKNDDFLAFARSLAEIAVSREPGAAEEQTAPDAGAEARREHHHPPLQARCRPRARSRSTCTPAPRSACWSTTKVRTRSGKDVAMHIAFARPAYLNKAEVPQDIVSEERRIQEARAKESGKPAEIAAKMVGGRRSTSGSARGRCSASRSSRTTSRPSRRCWRRRRPR